MARNPYTYDNMVIDSDEDISKVLPFFELFNENKKFTDTKFNVLNSLPSNITKKRVTDTYTVINGIKIPDGLVIDKGNEFKLQIHNDRTDTFEIYFIGVSGELKSLKNLEPDSTRIYSNFYIGEFMFLKNENNSDEVLVIKVGDDPVSTPGAEVQLSSITMTIDELEAVEPVIFSDELAPYSSKQGSVGDCYLLSSLISVYSYHPEMITSLFLYPEKMKETGAVVVRLYNKDEECWKTVILDDYLPMNGTKLYAAGPSGEWNNEYWVPFLEKAFAKAKAGSYPNLAGRVGKLDTELVMGMLIGPIKFTYMRISEKPDNGETFDKISEYYSNGSIVTFGSRDSKAKETNIAANHAYGLIEIMNEVTKQNLTLIKCHNPWSEGGEWIGDWSDKSPLWDKYPDVKEELGFEKKDDGTFWIDKKDFNQAFECAYIATYESEDVAEEGEEEGEEEQEEEYVKESVPGLNAKPSQIKSSVFKGNEQPTSNKTYSKIDTLVMLRNKVLKMRLQKNNKKNKILKQNNANQNAVSKLKSEPTNQKSSSCSIL